MADSEERRTLASAQRDVLKIYTSRVFPSYREVIESDVEEEVQQREISYQHGLVAQS